MSHGKDHAHEQIVAEGRRSFEGIREVVAEVEPATGPGQRAHAGGAGALERIRIACQPGGELHGGAACRQCVRFVNWVPSHDRTRVTIRCLWRESDPVADLMARAPSLPVVHPDTRLREAAAEAALLATPYLVVAEDGCFLGVLRAQDMGAGGELRARDRMVAPGCSVPATATLGDVAALMRARDAEVVPVIDADGLVGVITRAALRDAGLDAALDDACR